jgi:hypothetical protein
MFLQRVRSWLSTFLGGDSNQKPDRSDLARGPERAKSASSRVGAGISAGENLEVNRNENLRPEIKPSKPDGATEISSKKSGTIKPIDLIVGLDFGTAATKVVIRSPYLPGERARAISFGDLGDRSYSYLLPTRLRIGNDGQLTLRGDVSGTWLIDLKTALLDRGDEDSVGRAAGFIALVVKEAKQRFLAIEHETYRRFEPRWSVNIGIPSAGYDDAAIRERFRLAGLLGWKLADDSKPLTLQVITEAFRELEKSVGDGDSRIDVIPEVVAQAIGYARSPLRDPGLHLLVDIGASTLDVCGFFLRTADGQDNYDLLTATVHRLGVLELHRGRISALRCQENVNKFQQYDPLTPLPETFQEYHPACSCGAQDVDGQFRDKVAWIIVRHLADLKKRRDPNSDRWRTGLPVFFCGGGSAVKLFRSAAEMANEEFLKVMIAAPIQLRPLPKPATLINRDIGEGLYHRLSVAYGLSFEASNLGSISPPSKLEDIIPEKRTSDYQSRFVSKDQV